MPVVYVTYVFGPFMPIVVKCNIDRFRMVNLGHRPVCDGLTYPRKSVDNAMLIYFISYVAANIVGNPWIIRIFDLCIVYDEYSIL